MRDLTWGLLQWERSSLGLEFQANIVKFRDYNSSNNNNNKFLKIYPKKFYVLKLWDYKMYIQKVN